MESIGAFDAKTRLSELLERVRKGESFVITRHGHPVARLIPETGASQDTCGPGRHPTQIVPQGNGESLAGRAAGYAPRRTSILMSIVVDASALLCLAFDDEGVPYGSALIDAIHHDGAIALSILWYEIRNALIVNERLGRIQPEMSTAFLALLAQLPIAIRELPTDTGVMDLARRFQLSVYDAACLDLAIRERVPLASLDGGLQAAARALQIRGWEPPSSR
jgi:prevent-host-death family protein